MQDLCVQSRVVVKESEFLEEDQIASLDVSMDDTREGDHLLGVATALASATVTHFFYERLILIISTA